MLISTKNLNVLSNETLNLDSRMTEKNLKELILLITRRCFSDQWSFLTATYSHINVGSEKDISILELEQMVANITGYSCRIVTDATKPDGALRKLMDVTQLKSMGCQAKIALEDGVSETYSWFLQNNQSLRG